MGIEINKKYELQKPICGIYKITCKINNRVYIGQSTNIISRIAEHSRKCLRQTDDTEFQYDYDRWGTEAFEWELLEECSIENLLELEQKYIQKYGSDRLYNQKVPKPDLMHLSKLVQQAGTSSVKSGFRARKKDLQGYTRPPASGLGYSNIYSFELLFLTLYANLRSWRRVALPFRIHPNMARLIANGYQPGKKIREKLGLPPRTEIEAVSGIIPEDSLSLGSIICIKCKRPFISNHPQRKKCFVCTPFRPRSSR